MGKEKRSFDGVSAAVWRQIQARGQREHGTTFEQSDDKCGIATTPTPMGPVVLGYEFDAEAQKITYTILEKPFLAPSGLIWGGIAAAIDGARTV